MEFKKYFRTVSLKTPSELTRLEVQIKVEVHEDQDAHEILMDQDFETPKAKAEYEARIQAGEIFGGVISVTATALDLEGSDVLGGCELKPNNMFNSAPFNSSVEFYLTEHGMEQNAIDDLIRQLSSEYDRLQDLSTVYKAFRGAK